MTVDLQAHAEAILRAANVRIDELRYRGDKENVLTACAAFRNAVLGEAADWIKTQRNDIPACGEEFSAAILALRTKGPDHEQD